MSATSPSGRLGRWYRTSLVGHPVGRDFRRLWAGDTVSQLGTGVGEIAVQLLAVGALAATAFEMGLLGTVEKLAFLVVGLPAGAWVDRLRKRQVLVAGDVVRGVALLTLPVAWLGGWLSLPLVLAVVGLTGVATSTAAVVGPAVGGTLVRLLGAPLVIALDALSFLGSLVLTVLIRHREEPAPREQRRRLVEEVGEGLGFVAHQPLLRRIVATTAASNFFGSATGALLALYAVRELGLTAADLGLALGAGAVGGVLGALLVGPVTARAGEGRAITWPLLLTVPAAALLPLADGQERPVAIVMLAASGALTSVAVVVYNVAQVSFRQRLCPRPLLGRMNASVRFLVWGAAPPGAFAGGILATAVGVTATLWVAVGGLALSVLPVLLSPLARPPRER